MTRFFLLILFDALFTFVLKLGIASCAKVTFLISKNLAFENLDDRLAFIVVLRSTITHLLWLNWKFLEAIFDVFCLLDTRPHSV